MDSACHVIGCQDTHGTMVDNAFDDVASTFQSLDGGAGEAGHGVRQSGRALKLSACRVPAVAQTETI
jgi:hypothetical protein